MSPVVYKKVSELYNRATDSPATRASSTFPIPNAVQLRAFTELNEGFGLDESRGHRLWELECLLHCECMTVKSKCTLPDIRS